MNILSNFINQWKVSLLTNNVNYYCIKLFIKAFLNLWEEAAQTIKAIDKKKIDQLLNLKYYLLNIAKPNLNKYNVQSIKMIINYKLKI